MDDLVELDVRTRVRLGIVDQARQFIELGGQRRRLLLVDPPGGTGGHRALQGGPDLDQVVQVDQPVLALEQGVEDQRVEQAPLVLAQHDGPPALTGRHQPLLGERRRRLPDHGPAHLVRLTQLLRRRQRRARRVLAEHDGRGEALDDGRGERWPASSRAGHDGGVRRRLDHLVRDSPCSCRLPPPLSNDSRLAEHATVITRITSRDWPWDAPAGSAGLGHGLPVSPVGYTPTRSRTRRPPCPATR